MEGGKWGTSVILSIKKKGLTREAAQTQPSAEEPCFCNALVHQLPSVTTYELIATQTPTWCTGQAS